MDHIFVSCSFSRDAWFEVLQISSGKNRWEQISLEECFFSWISNRYEKACKALPFIVIWGIYLSRNIIFQGLVVTLAQ
jgi:hypothetical protein